MRVPAGTAGRPSKSLTLKQAQALITEARTSRLYAYVALCLLTGCRTEEARAAMGSRGSGRCAGCCATRAAACGACHEAAAGGRHSNAHRELPRFRRLIKPCNWLACSGNVAPARGVYGNSMPSVRSAKADRFRPECSRPCGEEHATLEDKRQLDLLHPSHDSVRGWSIVTAITSQAVPLIAAPLTRVATAGL